MNLLKFLFYSAGVALWIAAAIYLWKSGYEPFAVLIGLCFLPGIWISWRILRGKELA